MSEKIYPCEIKVLEAKIVLRVGEVIFGKIQSEEKIIIGVHLTERPDLEIKQDKQFTTSYGENKLIDIYFCKLEESYWATKRTLRNFVFVVRKSDLESGSFLEDKKLKIIQDLDIASKIDFNSIWLKTTIYIKQHFNYMHGVHISEI